MRNKYILRSKISEKIFREILWLFWLDLEATQVSKITDISRPTINKLFDKIREKIAEESEQNSPLGNGKIEVDKSYFGAKRVRGKRGRGASGKIPVFGMLKRNENVYTQIVSHCSIKELLPIIKTQAKESSTIYSDYFKTCDGLADYGYKQHYRVKHGENEFSKDGHNHINGIENFWGLCKVRLARFRGIHKHKFYLHLKECEFRYNNRQNSDKEVYKNLLKLIRNSPIDLSK